MKFLFKFFFIICIFAVLVACGNAETTPTQTLSASIQEITPTIDLCIEPALSTEITKVNKFMREFDDYATLASHTPQTQLIVVIPELQRVLREAQDQTAPVCLENLKALQVQHMQIVVQTLLAFMGNSVNTELVNTGIAQARDLHLQYDVEMARLLGITLQAPASPPSTDASVPTPTITPITLSNPGPNEINLWSAPDFNAPVTGAMPVQATAIALGRTADNLWIQVEAPNQAGVTAWVIASVAQLSASIDQLPIVNP
jgi:hypothetical protein